MVTLYVKQGDDWRCDISLNNFIPQIWADTLLAALRVNLVYGNLFNDDYEGE